MDNKCCANCTHGYDGTFDFIRCEIESPDSNLHYKYNFCCSEHQYK